MYPSQVDYEICGNIEFSVKLINQKAERVENS